MTMRTQKTFTFLLLLSFLFAEVSESAFPFSALNGFIESNPALSKKFSFDFKLPRNPDGIGKYAKKFEEYRDLLDKTKDALENLQGYGWLNSPEDRPAQIPDLQSEISKIQANFNLTVTGKADSDTMNILSKPRCDFPDKIDGTRTLAKVFKKQISLKPWWRNEKKKNLTYAFGNNVPVQVKSLFQHVFKRWSNALELKFTETKVIKHSDILIAFVKTDGKGGMIGSWDCIVGKR